VRTRGSGRRVIRCWRKLPPFNKKGRVTLTTGTKCVGLGGGSLRPLWKFRLLRKKEGTAVGYIIKRGGEVKLAGNNTNLFF